jgi:endonuclease-3 related protein
MYAGFKPMFVIDAYTRRIFSRLRLMSPPKAYKDFQKLFMDNLQPDVDLFNEYHALPVRLGNEICRKKPLCQNCCLKSLCAEAKHPR